VSQRFGRDHLCAASESALRAGIAAICWAKTLSSQKQIASMDGRLRLSTFHHSGTMGGFRRSMMGSTFDKGATERGDQDFGSTWSLKRSDAGKNLDQVK
jgi:hypothetical protein